MSRMPNVGIGQGCRFGVNLYSCGVVQLWCRVTNRGTKQLAHVDNVFHLTNPKRQADLTPQKTALYIGLFSMLHIGCTELYLP